MARNRSSTVSVVDIEEAGVPRREVKGRGLSGRRTGRHPGLQESTTDSEPPAVQAFGEALGSESQRAAAVLSPDDDRRHSERCDGRWLTFIVLVEHEGGFGVGPVTLSDSSVRQPLRHVTNGEPEQDAQRFSEASFVGVNHGGHEVMVPGRSTFATDLPHE